MRIPTPFSLFAPFLTDEDGATAIEYGLIAALVAIVIVAGLTALRGAMLGMYSTVSTEVVNATPGG